VGSAGLLPALAIAAGAVWGLHAPIESPTLIWALVPLIIATWVAWRRSWTCVCVGTLAATFACAAAVLTSDAQVAALKTPLRMLLDQEFSGFTIDTEGPAGRHAPLQVRARLLEDASRRQDLTTMRASVVALRVAGAWRPTRGDVTLTVGGRVPLEQADQWRAGRTVEGFATFRRPARYLNDGVPDFERQLALDGTTLFSAVKSGLLIDVRSRGSAIEETAARIRSRVRRSIAAHVAPYDPVSAGIVTAVLIGDRTGLPDETRLRLQAAGTFHVIAISGGNIAILAALTVGLLLICGVSGRLAWGVTILVLLAYAHIVSAGASVWRATAMAVLYLAARVLDHRTLPWQAIAAAAALIIAVQPLDVRNAGFLLTFGASAALIEGARRVQPARTRGRLAGWLLASFAASAAVEVTLLPVSATTFSRVTAAGLVLNLAAVPLMALVQISGIVVCVFDGLDSVAALAGWIAHAATSALIGSAGLVELVPWLSIRVPPPHLGLVITYYLALALGLATTGGRRRAGLALVVLSAAAIVTGQPAGWLKTAGEAPALRLTAFDVGQGDATLLRFPDRSTLLIDAGGTPFGSGAFDIGARVLSPALWAQGLRGIDTLLLTHGDPDHIGGARAIVDDFGPGAVWQGIPVATHQALGAVLHRATQSGARVAERRTGDEFAYGAARVRVLHPASPDWERPRVRNDDSVVLEVHYGDVSVLLMGDVGAAIEREILPRLSPSRTRILKAGHHGSRTSTSQELLDAWRPQIAIISCGRGNSFGHPAPEVLQRLESIGASIYRTDLHGQISIETDGGQLRVKTFR
jgi:competence protein ComEC